MPLRALTIIPLGLLVLSLIGCGAAQTSNWYGFTDALGTGSEVNPTQKYFNWRGDIEVHLTKAADPAWDPQAPPQYPYAGILMQLKPSGKPEDLSRSTGLAIEYRLSGTVSMMVKQKNMPAGKEYRVNLPPQSDFTLVSFAWTEFKQPSWVATPTPLDLSQAVGISFLNNAPEQTTAHLTIRKVSFPGL